MDKVNWINLLIIFLLSSICLIGQEVPQKAGETMDLVKLNNGSILEGRIVAIVPGEHIVFVTNSGIEVRIEEGQYQRFYQKKVRNKMKGSYEFDEKGFYHAYTFGLIMNTVSENQGGLVGFEMAGSAGHQFSRWLGIGGGISADYYHRRAGETIFPIFLEWRGYTSPQPATTYFTVRAGYGIAYRNEDAGIRSAEGGWMVNPVVGWRFSGRKGMNLTLDVGIKMQKAAFEYRVWSDRSDVDLLYRRLNARVGLLF